jgi:hypothetical protein
MEDGHRPLPAGQDVERVPDGLQGRNTKDTSILVRKHYMNQLLQTSKVREVEHARKVLE